MDDFVMAPSSSPNDGVDAVLLNAERKSHPSSPLKLTDHFMLNEFVLEVRSNLSGDVGAGPFLQ